MNTLKTLQKQQVVILFKFPFFSLLLCKYSENAFANYI